MQDELNYIKELQKAGFSREQSEAQINVIGKVMDQDFAKKSDLEMLAIKMDQKFLVVEEKINANRVAIDRLNSKFDMLSGSFDNLSGSFENLSGTVIKNLYIAIGVATALIGILIKS